jgi:histidyl-tRNA synthetase
MSSPIQDFQAPSYSVEKVLRKGKSKAMPMFNTPRGTQDFLPDEMAYRQKVQGVIQDTFEVYGFQRIQTPIFEEFALLAARSGEEIRERMFTFVCDEVEYALRPELTAPVCRLVANRKMDVLPRPHKVYYIGPCFRYERPQEGRYREFGQAGVELIGSSSPIADAEVITVAARVLQHLGITAYTLKVGNIGIFRDVLAQEGFDDEIQSRVISDIDRRIISVREKCETILGRGSIEHDDIEYVRGQVGDLYRLQEEIGYSGEYEIIPQRTFDEVAVQRWLKDLPLAAEATCRRQWTKRRGVSESLAELLIEISKVRGGKDTVSKVAQDLVGGTGAEKALANLMEVTGWIDCFKAGSYEIVLGVARGLNFYTGTVFEFDGPLRGAQKRICGGGRYDRLIGELGGSEMPATGFALDFDRVVAAFKKSDGTTDATKAAVFVATISDDLRPRAVEIAEMLRANGLSAEVDLMAADARSQLSYASRIGCRYAVILGAAELEQGSVIVKSMDTGEEKTVRIAELTEDISPGVQEA